MNPQQRQRLVKFFYEVGVLRKTLRAHQQTLLMTDPTDNIAAHSFRVAMIGYFLAKALGADVNKVIKMCLIHDLEEARAGDHNWVNKKYVKVFEEEIREEQLEALIGADELRQLNQEYQQRETKEAKIAKDADTLDQLLLLKEYEHQGNKGAANWLKLKPLRFNSSYKKSFASWYKKIMFFELSRELAKEIEKQDPSQWWYGSWTPKRR